MADRIDGSPIDGSTVIFRRVDGAFDVAVPVNVRYEIRELPTGDYRATIIGPSHVAHTTLVVSVTDDRRDLDFSVLEWGAAAFGSSYDAAYDLFFDDLARQVTVTRGVWKWDLLSNPPREFQVDPGGISSESLGEFLELLEEVNSESVPEMFAGRVSPLPVNLSSSSGLPPDGVILLQFWNDVNVSDGAQIGGVRRWGRVRFNLARFEGPDREYKKWVILHEVFHVAFATHLSDENNARFPGSAMSATRVQRLSNADRLASWIVYQDGTAPGNEAPDVNPTYAAPQQRFWRP